MRILITGSNGYIGNALVHALLMQGQHAVLGVDTAYRKKWVNDVGGVSLTQYPDATFLHANMAMQADCVNVLNYFRPELIIHLASQPSGPYSEITTQHRIDTQINNVSCLLNLLYLPKDMGFKPRYIVATTTGIPGAPGEAITESHMPNLAGSSYHASRGFDSANINLAVRQLGLDVLELRTSIVYGTRIYNLNEAITRFDWDFWFGTVIHRFLVKRMKNDPITIYGKGLQMKPIISLRDCVKSFVNAIDASFTGHEIMNQTTECLSVVNMASCVGGSITHIPNPRVEKEDYQMNIKNEKFLKLLGDSPSTLASEIFSMRSDINTGLLPTNWREIYDGLKKSV